MGYGILRAGERVAAREGVCALAVMAKAPRAGKVKTRLAPALGFEGSAAINICFLRDTTRNIAEVCDHPEHDDEAVMVGAPTNSSYPEHDDETVMVGAPEGLLGEDRSRFPSGMTKKKAAAGLVCYTPVGDEAAFDGLLPEGFALIPQRGDGFGERLLAAAEDILACGFGAVCLIDSDSPTLPQAALVRAVEELLRTGDRVVLGGSEDGGYYLIGLKQAHAAPFARITWSTGSVYAETLERCAEAGIEVVELPTWYDVDDAATLAVLEAELIEGTKPGFAAAEGYVDGYDARSTREFLMGRREERAR
jgi:glycosyltransferase A (GT-A) superfamily protein (DUF2064 family)